MDDIIKPATASLEIHLLGPFEIRVGGVPVDRKSWQRRKPKQLVKLLALQPNYKLHREQAMELLWPDADPETATNSLNKAIHAARLALEPQLSKASHSHFIVTEEQQVALRSPHGLRIDAEEFERLAQEAVKTSEIYLCEAALSLYRGELLVEDRYEEWVVAPRERLRDTYLNLLKRFAWLREEGGDHDRSIELLRLLIAVDPTDETASRDLMRLHARIGDRHQAFVQYAQCVKALGRELDVGPERATVELYHQIVAGNIKLQTQLSARTQTTNAFSEPPLAETSPPHYERHQRTYRERILDSIAVLPFGNEDSDPQLAFLSEGLSESIIGRLSQLPQLRVIAWSSVTRYRGARLDLARISRDLEARVLLTGNVLQVDDRLVVKVELSDAMDGTAFWSEQFNSPSSDIFAVQEEIARSVSEKLWLELIAEDKRRLGKRYTDNKEAFELYVKGRFCWNTRASDRLQQAIEYFEQAVELDPSYALAYSGLSDSYNILASYGVLPPREGFGKGKEFASRALALDDNLAEAHAAMGYVKAVHEWNWDQAEAELRRAMELKPQDVSQFHWLGNFLIAVRGDIDAGLVAFERARQNDPVSLISLAALGWGLYFARQYDRAIMELRKAIDLDPYYYLAHVYLGRAYLQKGEEKEASSAFSRALSLNPGATAITAETAYTFAVTEEREKAIVALNELLASAKRKYVSPYWLALINLGLGNIDQVFFYLEEAYEERSGYLFWLNVEPRFDCLRGDQRFLELLWRIGF